MKHAFPTIVCLLLSFLRVGDIAAQAPPAFHYQAALRSNNGNILDNETVTVRINLLDSSSSGDLIYQEIHNATTTAQGLVNLKIGAGTLTDGDWESIKWGAAKKFLKVEIDTGNGYTTLGTQQLVSVPYALQAANTEAIAGSRVATTPPVTGKVLKWNGAAWTPATDANTTVPSGAAGGNLTGTYPDPTIANNAITTPRINNAAVTTAKINNAAVTTDKVAANAITTPKIADATITAAKVATNAITTAKLVTGAVTSAKMGANAVITDKIANTAVTAAKLNNMGATNGQVLKYNGQAWVPAADNNTEGWGVNGNNVTNGQFIGSTNNIPLMIKVNGERAGLIGFTVNKNTSLGYRSLNNSSLNQYNTAFGQYVLDTLAIGQSNTGVGHTALKSLYSGGSNTSIGAQTLLSVHSGEGNTAVGYKALRALPSGLYNTALGYNTLPTNTNLYNCLGIGYNAWVPSNASNRVRIGNNQITHLVAQVAWTTASDGRIKKNVQENVPGLAFISKLRPVTYTFDVHKQNELTDVQDDSEYPEKYALEQITQTGLIAQEVEAAAKELNYDFSGVAKPANEKDIYGLRYSDLIMPLIKGMQEQQELIEHLKEQIKHLEKQVADLQ